VERRFFSPADAREPLSNLITIFAGCVVHRLSGHAQIAIAPLAGDSTSSCTDQHDALRRHPQIITLIHRAIHKLDALASSLSPHAGNHRTKHPHFNIKSGIVKL
jgi:hypothetical protein